MVHYRSETLVAYGVQLEMPPHPDIPIYVAGRGPLTLQVAGELAEVAVIGALLSSDGIRFAIEQVRLGATRADRRLSEVGLMSWISCYITDNKPQWIEFYRPNAAHILAGAPPPVFDALKLGERFMEELKTLYAEGGSQAAARLVPDDLVLQLAAIGDPAEVTEQLQCAAELGINQFGILVNAPTVAESERMLRRFSEEVMPNL
jgi:5,10-methylenetetrahydromethanopterin reductase